MVLFYRFVCKDTNNLTIKKEKDGEFYNITY